MAVAVVVVLVALGGGTGTGSSDGSTPADTVVICEHDFSTVGYDDYIHWKQCSKCGEKQTNSEETHTLENASDDGGNSGTHSYSCTFEGCELKIKTKMVEKWVNVYRCSDDSFIASKLFDNKEDAIKCVAGNDYIDTVKISFEM